MDLAADLHMWVVLGLAGLVVVLYVTEWVPMELTSLGLIGGLLVWFQVFPFAGPDGANAMSPAELLSGFSNPALITVLALLVIGEGLVQTGALERVARAMAHPRLGAVGALTLLLGTVAVLSGVLNNTPIVVIFIPILQLLARRFQIGGGRVMIPLSYAAILGGMTTVIGSSTNLLVSDSLAGLGYDRLGFFEFLVPGGILALAGLAYVFGVLPWLLPKSEAEEEGEGAAPSGRHYLSQVVVPADSPLIGQAAKAGRLDELPEVTVRMIERGKRIFLPPYAEYEVQAGDVLVISANRETLSTVTAHHPGLFHPPARRGKDETEARIDSHEALIGPVGRSDENAEDILVEVMVTPSSRLVGQSLRQIGFRRRYRGLVLGIQRRARMIRARLTEIRLEAGDVLLVQTRPIDVPRLYESRDLVVVSGTTARLTRPRHARATALVFFATVIAAASGAVPIVAAAVVGATAIIGVGALNLRQAARALDRKVLLVIAAAIALGGALQTTGGAGYLAHGAIAMFQGAGPAAVMSGLFLMTALFTNVLTNNAVAVLFTPIAVNLALEASADPRLFAITVLLGANCSFASPVGYQTNLLVLGPGDYRFVDFVKAGLPLVVFLWLVYTAWLLIA